MVQYVFTPWRDRQELLAVRRQLYPQHHGSDDAASDGSVVRQQQQQHAVARVSMWMQRGNCPHMVESTALLTAAILGDAHAAAAGSAAAVSSGSYAARAAYSAAFSRFVTGLLDSNQDKQHKMSMFAVAKSVGLPATFVELRHQATHEQLPSLTRMRVAARSALDWIWEYYWRHLPGDAAATPPHPPPPGDAVSGACRGAVAGCLAAADGDRPGRGAAGLLARFAQAEVLRAVEELGEQSRDPKVLRRVLSLTRDIMLAGVEGDAVDGDGPQSKDIESARAEIDRSCRQLQEKAEAGPDSGVAAQEGRQQREHDEHDEHEVRDEGPSWSRYDSSCWAPRPIGIV